LKAQSLLSSPEDTVNKSVRNFKQKFLEEIHMRVSKLGLFVLLLLSLSACFRQPTPVDESISSNAGLIASTLPINGATNIRGQKVTINFSEAMDKASVEQGFSLFAGKYNPATTPSTFAKLQLTAMCDGRWRVRNTNAFPLSFTWDAYKEKEEGIGVAPANTDTFFYTALRPKTGNKTVRVFVNGQQQQVKANNTTACTSPAYTFEWSTDAKKVIITSATPLTPNTEHTATLSTLSKSLAGTKLIVPFSFSFKTYDPNGPARTEGALTPGGTFTGVDGIVIDAAKAQLDRTLNIYVERVTDTSKLLALSQRADSPLKAETAYYKLGATERYRSKGTLLVYVPMPEVRPQKI
jgi:Bacterial Ig-like domain